eukprot:3977051-Amphidinium_carterae.2
MPYLSMRSSTAGVPSEKLQSPVTHLGCEAGALRPFTTVYKQEETSMERPERIAQSYCKGGTTSGKNKSEATGASQARGMMVLFTPLHLST